MVLAGTDRFAIDVLFSTSFGYQPEFRLCLIHEFLKAHLKHRTVKNNYFLIIYTNENLPLNHILSFVSYFIFPIEHLTKDQNTKKEAKYQKN